VNRSLLELLSAVHPAVAAGAALIPNAVAARPYPGLDSCGRDTIRAELGFSRDVVMITLASNLRDKKSPGLLLRALASLPRLPVTRLLIWGRVHPGEREQFDADVGRLGLADRVVVRERIPQEAVPQWLEASDIVIMPSVDEGMSNVMLEAMERARCVVAADGFADCIRHEVNGILADPLDPSALGGALAALASDPEKREALGAAARALVLAECSPDREAGAYIRLYERLVDS
jgi:glycosyltransferase involved in cell wall biosynthesis